MLARILPGLMEVRPTNMFGGDRTEGCHEDEGEAHLLVECAKQGATVQRAQGAYLTDAPAGVRSL